jgi:type VI protein secretion system component Hcp
MAAYIKFDQVEGPCQIDKHEGWIVMDSWNWEAERQVSGGNQIGLASGVAKFGVLSFSAPIGSATVTMFNKMVAGQHFASVLVECTKNTGKEAPEVWLKLKLEHVLVTKIAQTVDEDENQDEIELSFSQVDLRVKDQLGDGTLDSKKEKIFIYDITKATSSSKG